MTSCSFQRRRNPSRLSTRDPFPQQCPIPFVHLAATCSESSSSGFWTGGELRTAFSDEVGPCLNAVLLLLGEMPSVAGLRIQVNAFWHRGLSACRRCSTLPFSDAA